MHRHKGENALVVKTVVVLASILGLAVTSAVAEELPQSFELNPAELAASTDGGMDGMLAQADEPVMEETTVTTTDDSALPISFGISYALMSDYIFRGVNFSEFGTEGREKPNHQLDVWFEWDTGDFGTIGLETWFEWYAAQSALDPDRGGQNLQEVDFLVYWGYSIDAIATDLTIGYTYYLFPNLSYALRHDDDPSNNHNDRTMEWWFSLEHNDAWMWTWLFPDNEDGILNPSFYLAHDFGTIPGVWMEMGFSHDFMIPGVDNLTITPAWTLMAECDYWQDGLALAGDQWSLGIEYDLTPVLQMPDWAGSLAIGGEIHWFNAYDSLTDAGVAKDEFYGGVSVSWSWGG